MTQLASRADYSALSERMGNLLLLRLAMAAIVTTWAVLRPEALTLPIDVLLTLNVGYLAVAAVDELARRRLARFDHLLLTVPLLLDGLYLACAMYTTGGTQSPIRFLVYLHLVAVSLLASYRTGLKIALWHSLLLFVVLYAQAAKFVPAVDSAPGDDIEFDRMAVLNITSFWLFAIATSIFSALNERELRQRRSDLQSLVDVARRLDEVGDPLVQSRIVLDGLMDRFGFERGLVLGVSDGRVVALASSSDGDVPTTAAEPDWILKRSWDRRDVLPVRRLDERRDPFLCGALPKARNVLVAPMIADGQPTGAIVVEHRARRIPGVERRVAAMVSQFASIAALNLRNSALLHHVRDLAERDSLTGAANRRTFQVTLDRVLAAERQSDSKPSVSAVLFIDLDDFKVVNDTLGHGAGDALLVEVTERIYSLVRETDLVARLGGDEFAVLIQDDRELKRSRAMAERLVRQLCAPYTIGEHQVVVTASVGVASARGTADDAADLVRNADMAMYMAKANGKSGFAIFDPSMHEAIRERHELSAEIGQAVEDDQLRLVYQPIVNLETGVIAGVEALVRWQHPDRGLVMPARFIELAEETGAILPIGRWVLRQACRDAGRWLADGQAPSGMFVSVNVSAREIQQRGFVDGVKAALAETGLEPASLILEITETALLRATPATIATLDELRTIGVRTVIDDFGTGYFSLSHLRQFPVDVLKIASEFVRDADEVSKSSALAGAIVALGHSLGIETVAEGIETAQQAARMRVFGCTYGQGYHFSRPVSGPEFVEQLALQVRTTATAAVTTDGSPDPAGPAAAEPRGPGRSRRRVVRPSIEASPA